MSVWHRLLLFCNHHLPIIQSRLDPEISQSQPAILVVNFQTVFFVVSFQTVFL